MAHCLEFLQLLVMQLQEMLNEQYQVYTWNCHNQGDIWWLNYRAYTFQEWVEEGCPENGGVTLKKTI